MGCLGSAPAPVWYYMQIEDSGTLEILISQQTGSGGAGVGLDVDFAMWGPFSSVVDGCNQVESGMGPIQCSYSSAPTETIGLGVQGGYSGGLSTPPAGVSGEYYIVLITNYSETAGNITLEQVGGTGSTNCAIVIPCQITEVTATPGNCDSNYNFNLTGQITFDTDEAPTTGDLIVEDCHGNQVVAASAPFTSPISYTLSNIDADGSTCQVTAYFSDEPNCSKTSENYISPDCDCDKPALTVDDLIVCDETEVDLLDAIEPNTISGTITYHSSETDAQNGTNSINSTVNTNGTYWIRAEASDDADCFNIYPVVVKLITLSYTVSSTDATCGANDGSLTLTVTGGDAPYTYSIDGGNTTQNNGVFSGLSAGSYNIIITDNNDCEVTGEEAVANIDGVEIDEITLSHPSCHGDCDGTITVEASGGATPYIYSFTDSNNNTQSGNSNTNGNRCSGTYIVQVTDANGCINSQTITLTQPGELDATFSGLNDDYCNSDGTVTLNPVQPGGTFSGPGVTGNTFDPATAGLGTHTITYTVENGDDCIESYSLDVTVNGPTANFTANPTETTLNNTEVEFTNNSEDADSYAWNFGDGSNESNDENPTHFFPNDEPGTYIVTLYAYEGNCVDSTQKTINIIYPDPEYEIPNIFTPNNDGDNDFFKLVYHINVESLEVTILNRWGNLVFESSDVNFHWNGKIKNSGAECSEGVYFYKMKLIDFAGNEHDEHGFVHLNRGK